MLKDILRLDRELLEKIEKEKAARTDLRLWTYKITYDHGSAPCAQDDILSLAVCKPMLRKNAVVGDWIFGFGAVDKYQARLLAIYRVTKILPPHVYYTDPQYAHRRDCIYEEGPDGKPDIKPNANYHREDYQNLLYDVGENWENAYVLLSTDFRYLGIKGGNNYTPKLAPYVRRLGVGAPYQHPPEIASELEDLLYETFHRHDTPIVGDWSTSRSPNYWKQKPTWSQAGRRGVHTNHGEPV
jgi:Nucleotide modification associated domain 2